MNKQKSWLWFAVLYLGGVLILTLMGGLLKWLLSVL